MELRSPDGRLEATYLPEAGMRCASLRRDGAELLAGETGLPDPVLSAAMHGIPLLHPWANRLRAEEYEAGGRTGRLPSTGGVVPRDGDGVAIHGLIAAPDAWEATVSADGASVSAFMEFPTDEVRAAAFPFPHRMALEVALDARGLAVRVRMEPTAGVAVPVAFGFHPFMRAPAGVLGEAAVDETRRGFAPGAELSAGGWTLRLGSGFGVVQVYAPAGAEFVCLEPMTAPPNALLTGEELPWTRPGDVYEADFGLLVP